MHFHRRAVGGKDLRRGHPQYGAVDQRDGARVGNPAGRRLADDLTQLQRPVPFREILGI